MFKELIRSCISLVAPSMCVYCHTFLNERAILCTSCNEHIKPIVSTTINVTSSRIVPIQALSAYEDPLRPLILAKNYGGIIASHQLGKLMCERMPLENMACDYIVPVPLYWLRYTQRGFNQAEIIAQQLAKKFNRPVLHAVKRKKRTLFQASLSATQRAHNVSNVFELACSPALLANKHIILVDDLMTTGSTLSAVSKVIFEGRPRSVRALVACRAI